MSNPQIVSLRSVARKLGVSTSDLRELASRAAGYYREFAIKTGSKVRMIDNPTGDLKLIQSRLYRRALRDLSLPPWLHGGVRGCSPLTNATAHVGRAYLTRIDVKNFFPSLTSKHVFRIWRDLGYSSKISAILTKLTTYRGHLPQGAPTSTALANLALVHADEQIQQLAAFSRASYTRFVDDMCISGPHPETAINTIIRILREEGLGVSHKKLKIKSRAHRQEITGYVVNSSSTPSKNRQGRNRVRSAIHKLARTPRESRMFDRDLRSIRGRIADIGRTNPGAAMRLERQLANLCLS